MIIGVPRERKTLEKRVALTPDGAQELVKRGHQVLIEQDAGLGSHYTNEAYRAAGCTIAPTLADVFNKSQLVVKVKEPHESEYQYFRKDLFLFCYLHLASMPDVTKAMLQGGVNGIAYELVQTSDRRLPLLEPMSEVAGKLSILNGSFFLLSQNGGRGVLLGGSIGVTPAEVVIIGAGIAGRAACELALGLGAQATILDTDPTKLERIKVQFQNRARTLYSTKASIEREVLHADLLIGAVLIPGAAAPRIISEEIVKKMKKGAVIVDISIDQGGCVETIRPTSLDAPVYEKHDIIHYGVCNMPAQVPVTSTQALTAATLPYVIKLCETNPLDALRNHVELRNALNTFQGILTNQAVSDAVNIAWKSPGTILPA